MSAPQFTPGPWSKHDCFDPTGQRLTSRDIVPPGRHSLSGVAVLASVFSNEQDARLIATAPELYEAGEELSDKLWILRCESRDEKSRQAADAAIKMWRAACAKAQGEQQ